ncbi:MAG: PEP-CTERM sorting domain-containing protein [Myxococcales bacterium]|nr:PEP-CTERM sorting domain-containing protein [Myxococcales bacterium]
MPCDHSRLVRIAALLALAITTLVTHTIRASDLEIYEASAAPGLARAIASPAVSVPLDVDYAPASSEGGAIYGFSELRLVTTGDVIFTPTGFWCEVTSCLHHPLPFVAGPQLLVTGGDDLSGELAVSLDLVSISISGSNGVVALVGGEYLDATGPGGGPGAIRTVDARVLAVVPEPGSAIATAIGVLALTAGGRRRRT